MENMIAVGDSVSYNLKGTRYYAKVVEIRGTVVVVAKAPKPRRFHSTHSRAYAAVA